MAHAAVQTFVGRIMSSLLGICTGIIIARTLGPVGKGIFSAPLLMLALPVAVTSGIGMATTYFMTKKQQTIRDLFPSLTVFFGSMLVLLWMGTVGYALLHGWNLVSVTFAVVAPPTIVLSWQTSYYVATGSLFRLNVQRVAYSLVSVILIAIAIFIFHAGTKGALIAWVIATYAAAIVIVVDAVRDGGRFDGVALRENWRSLGKLGAQCGLNDVLLVLSYRVDSYVLVILLGLTPFGIYSVAVGIGEALLLLTRPLATAVSREIGIADLQRAAVLTARTVRLSVLLTAATGALSFAVAPLLLTALYGPRFDPAIEALRWLLPGIVALSTADVFMPFFIYQLGSPKVVTIVSVATIILQAGLCFALVPRFGIAGAAMGSTGSYILGAVINTIFFCRKTKQSAASAWIIRWSDLQQLWTIARSMRLKRLLGESSVAEAREGGWP